MLALALAAIVVAAPPRETSPMTHEAKGRFDVELKPGEGPGKGLGRMSIAKRFHGDLEGTSVGEMLTAGAPQTGSAGYVAIERVEGTLGGRAGSFALQHSGTMDAGRHALSIEVAPGSGEGALAGLSGAMTIDAANGHAYVFRYTLPPSR